MSKARKPHGTAEIAAIAIGMDTQDKQIHGTSIMGEKTSVITTPDRPRPHMTHEPHHLHSSNEIHQLDKANKPATLKSHDLIREVASRFIDFAKQDSI